MQRRRRQRGFSLIEVLSGVFLASLCAVIVAGSLPVASQARLKADLTGKATNLAQQELERIRGTGYPGLTASALVAAGLIDSATPVAGNTYAFTNVGAGTNQSCAQMLPTGTGTVMIEQVDLDLRRVTVIVTYNDRGTTRNASVGTLVANL